MKTDTAFFGMLVQSALHGLGDFYDFNESQLTSAKRGDLEKIHKEVYRDPELSKDQRYAEFEIEMGLHETKFDMLRSNLLRYSFIVLASLVLEDHLHRFCLALKDIGEYSDPVPNPSHKVLESYKDYIESHGIAIEPHLWEPIFDLNTIRNCVVHASGDLNRYGHREKIEAILKKGGIQISSLSTNSKFKPLYLTNQRLIIEQIFCYKLVDDLIALFSSLCHLANLPTKVSYKDHKITFESE